MRLYHLLKTYYHLTKTELNDFVLNHKILINEKETNLSTVIGDNDIVSVDGNIISHPENVIYLYHKPRGVTSVISDKEDSYIFHIDVSERVFPAGRLDKDSEGLLLLTNNHQLLNEITKNKTIYDKEYIVKCRNEINQDFLKGLEKPQYIGTRLTKECKTKYIDNYTFSIILYEGMYHQIRKLVKQNGNTVVELKRIRIGKYLLDDLKENEIKKIIP